MTLTEEEVSTRYPIHWLVWNNEHEELKASLKVNKFTAEDIELKDPRGRTPLLLAVTLGQTRTSRALIEAGADINCEKDGWTAVQEATATGNPKLLSLVLSHRDYQRHLVRSGGIPDLLQRLSLAPDFYVEMKWEFTSWVPLVSRMCPFDTYKVYKRGGNVRVDTTLVGFENNRWQRGDRTYIFRGHGQSASLVELDHVARSAWLERVGPSCARSASRPSRSVLRQRLTAPLALNYLDTDKISFERNKCGIWGWRQDKTEEVNGYECKVFSANNVEVVSATRTEHLSGGARRALVHGPAPLAGLLALADAGPDAAAHAATHAAADNTPDTTPDAEETNGEQSDSGSYGSSIQDTDSEEGPSRRPPPAQSVSWQQYFGAPDSSDIGRPRELTTKVQKFRATLWLCENYPLELQEQIMPILDLMAAISSPHFAKLKDFIQMQLPAGFPVKIEIPLFHVLNARITFGNIFATESPVPYIESIHEGDRLACVVDDLCFNVGAGYKDAASCEDRLACAGDEDEGLLQYAIQQSLMDPGTHDDQVDVWEALRGARPASPAPPRPADLMDHEETQLQRAIEASLAALVLPREAELSAALEQSAREQREAARLLQDEQRALDEAIRASMLDH